MKLLPFNFERWDNGKIFISNMLGFHHVLNNSEELESLIDAVGDNHENDLYYKKFLVHENEYSTATQLYASSYAWKTGRGIVNPYLFIVVPTLRCDHDCNYCQVSRVNSSASGFDLDLEHIPQIVTHILKYGKAPYKIEFQGGEPLLAFDFIKEFIEYVEANHDEATFEYVIATSLSLLSQDVLDFSKNRPIHFSVSLDGTPIIHNANRKHKLINSYERVGEGIKEIQKQLGSSRVATVTTVTKELIENPKAIVEAHIAMQLNDMFVRPLSPYGFSTKTYNRNYGVEEYTRFYHSLLDILVETNSGYRLVEQNLLIHLERIFRKDLNNYVDLKSPAGHVMGALVFNYDGNVFGSDEARMLHKLHGVESLILGKVNEELSILGSNETINILSDSFISEIPGCDECAYQPFCGVDPMYHLSTQYDHIGNRARSDFCKLQKYIFAMIFQKLEIPKFEILFHQWMEYE